MLRETFVEKYNHEVREIVQELLRACTKSQFHFGDILVCQQNGTIAFNGPMLGLGMVGFNYYKQINQVIYKGIGNVTKDKDIYIKSREILFDGTSEFEQSVEVEMHNYQLIWENGYFLRTLKELSLLLNGEHYDWELDIDSKTKNTRSNYIRDAIIGKFENNKKFQDLLLQTYNRDLRNSLGHSQYCLIQGGIVLTNVPAKDGKPFFGFSFEEWEERYAKSWLLMAYIFSGLKDIMEGLAPLCKVSETGGLPILVPLENKKWKETTIYYVEEGKRWTFYKT